MVFSGPVLGLGVRAGEDPVIAQGPFLRIKDKLEKKLNSQIHGIVEPNMVFGGREVTIGNNPIIQAEDWILAATVCENHLFLALMHNRVAVYSPEGPLRETIACPTHAMLYSAHIEANVTDDRIHVFVVGGGVMCNMHFWSFTMKAGETSAITSDQTVRHHKGSIFKIRSAADNRLLSTSDDRSVCLWENEKVVKEYRGHQARVWDAIAFTLSNGRSVVVTACEDSLVRVFDLDTSELIDAFTGHKKDVRVLAHDVGRPDIVWSGGEDGSVIRWTLAENRVQKWRLASPLENDWIRDLHYQGSRAVITVSNFGYIFMQDCESGVELNATITCSALIENTYLVAGTADGHVIIVPFLLTYQLMKRFENCVPTRVVSIFAVKYIKKDYAVAVNHNGSVAVFECGQRIQVASFQLSRGQDKTVGKILAFASWGIHRWLFADDKGFMYIVHAPLQETRTVKSALISRVHKCVSLQVTEKDVTVNLSKGTSVVVTDLEGVPTVQPESITKSPYASFLVCSGEIGAGFTSTDFVVYDSSCVQFRQTCGGHRRPFDFYHPHIFDVHLAFRKRLGVWSQFDAFEENRIDAIRFAYAEDNRTVCEVTAKPRAVTVHAGCNGDLIHAIVSSDENGDYFLTANEDNSLRVIQQLDMNMQQYLSKHEGSVRALCTVEDLILSGGARSHVVLSRKVKRGQVAVVASIVLPTDTDVRVMSISGFFVQPNHYRFLAVTSSTDMFMIDWQDGELKHTLLPAVADISKSVCLSSCWTGNEFAVGAGNGYVCLISSDGRFIKSERIHQSGINGMTLTGCGKYLVTVGDDQSVATSDITTLSQICRIEDASVCSIRAVTAEGDRVFTTGTDRRVSEWSVQDGKLTLKHRIRTAVTDPLSLCMLTKNEIAVGGRGLEIIRI
jgi:WD40 repeat protein